LNEESEMSMRYLALIAVCLLIVSGCVGIEKTTMETEEVSTTAPEGEKAAAPEMEEGVSPSGYDENGVEPEEGLTEDELMEERLPDEEGLGYAGLDQDQAEEEKSALTMQVEDTGRLLVIYFDYDRYTINDDELDHLKENANWLLGRSDVDVKIEGHADERGTDEYNLALGERRATSVKKFLEDSGIDSTRLQTISYGEEKPADYGNNEEAWRLNRRVEFLVIE